MPAHVNVVVEYVKRPQYKPGDAAHVLARRVESLSPASRGGEPERRWRS